VLREGAIDGPSRKPVILRGAKRSRRIRSSQGHALCGV
jgi:hypothetical protein